ncbi:unnamed protein product [Cochlearia groenlandica]
MSSSSCPICNLTLPFSQIERHVNTHFYDGEEEEFDPQIEIDHQLALLIASSSSSPYIIESPTSSSQNGDVLATLPCSQNKTKSHSLICLLKNCLEQESKKSKPNINTTSLLSSFVDHYQSTKEDKGWGCGWRNIQMQCSHLFSNNNNNNIGDGDEVKKRLFDGSTFVPDVPSLQRWLEIAWSKGFDVSGSHHFGARIHGSNRWIGTTECAALLRSFGLRARIVDFAPGRSKSTYLSVPGSSVAPKVKAYGPMDRYLVKKDGKAVEDGDKRCFNRSVSGKGAVLMEWVWNYFSDNRLNVSSGVHMTNKGPLYFQHEGHSRTIIGIQRRIQGIAFTPMYNLLILDPGDSTKAIEKSLVEKKGWEGYIKRGAHTLTCPEYQILYVDKGIADGEELEKLKTIDSHFVEF